MLCPLKQLAQPLAASNTYGHQNQGDWTGAPCFEETLYSQDVSNMDAGAGLCEPVSLPLETQAEGTQMSNHHVSFNGRSLSTSPPSILTTLTPLFSKALAPSAQAAASTALVASSTTYVVKPSLAASTAVAWTQ